MAGRPTKYTPETVAKLMQAIELGATYELACGYAGISADSFARWREKADFAEKLRDAEGRASVKWLAKIEQAGNIDWRAVAWKLERRYPHSYGKSVTEQTLTATINHRDLSAFTDDQIAAMADVAEQVASGALKP